MQVTATVIAYVEVLRALLDDSSADDAHYSLVVTADEWWCAVVVAVAVAVAAAVTFHIVPELNQPSSFS